MLKNSMKGIRRKEILIMKTKKKGGAEEKMFKGGGGGDYESGIGGRTGRSGQRLRE